MRPVTFQATLMSGHKEYAVEVSFDLKQRWAIAAKSLRPGRRAFRVAATLNGVAFEGAIVARSKQFWLLVPATVEQATNTGAGDVATISIAPVEPPRPTHG